MYEVTTEMNRSKIQKSIVLISDAPVYGLMEQRIQPIMELFFANGPDQFNHQLMIDWFPQVDLPVSIDHIQEQLDLSDMIELLQSNTLRILKLIILQRKVLVYGSPARHVCRLITTLLSLLPGQLEWEHLPLTTECEEFHFPLPLFNNKEHIMEPYLPVQKVGGIHRVTPKLSGMALLTLTKIGNIQSAQSFLVGACNMLFTQADLLHPDIIVHVRIRVMMIDEYLLT